MADYSIDLDGLSISEVAAKIKELSVDSVQETTGTSEISNGGLTAYMSDNIVELLSVGNSKGIPCLMDEIFEKTSDILSGLSEIIDQLNDKISQ